jgi:hypothetical protein
MRKHEVSYHDHLNDIFFLFNHCSHLEALERSFSILSTQIKEILQESRTEKNDFKLTRILKRNENIEQELIKVSETKKLIEIKIEIKDSTEISISSKKKKKRRKKNQKIKSIVIEIIDSKIYMIETTSFNLLIRQKEAQMFALFFKEIDAQIYSISQANIDIQLNKIEKISIDSRTLISLEYHDFLNVFFKREINKLFSHRKNHDDRIELKEEKVDHEYALLYRMLESELLLIK